MASFPPNLGEINMLSFHTFLFSVRKSGHRSPPSPINCSLSRGTPVPKISWKFISNILRNPSCWQRVHSWRPLFAGVRGQTVYNLYAVVNHVGNTFDGHYTASAKHPYTDEWRHFNDHRYWQHFSQSMKKFIRHAGSNTNITMTMSMQRQICT